MIKKKQIGAAVVALALVAGTAVSVQAAPKTLIISSDLPLQGSAFDANDSTNKAIQLYLSQQKNMAGKFKIEFKT